MRKRRSYTKSFKAEAVRLLEQSGKPAAELARELEFREISFINGRRKFRLMASIPSPARGACPLRPMKWPGSDGRTRGFVRNGTF
jgi:transposase-like protein